MKFIGHKTTVDAKRNWFIIDLAVIDEGGRVIGESVFNPAGPIGYTYGYDREFLATCPPGAEAAEFLSGCLSEGDEIAYGDSSLFYACNPAILSGCILHDMQSRLRTHLDPKGTDHHAWFAARDGFLTVIARTLFPENTGNPNQRPPSDMAKIVRAAWMSLDAAGVPTVPRYLRAGSSHPSTVRPPAARVPATPAAKMPATFPAARERVRMVAFDVETATHNHIVGYGLTEVVDDVITGKTLSGYIRPTVPVEAFNLAVHGLTDEFLRDKPRFADRVSSIMAFIGDAAIIAHNEHVERHALNAELARLGMTPFPKNRFICTMAMARKSGRFDNNKLRTVCEMSGVPMGNLADRHDALTDANLAARAYLALTLPPACGARWKCPLPARASHAPRETADRSLMPPSPLEAEAMERRPSTATGGDWFWVNPSVPVAEVSGCSGKWLIFRSRDKIDALWSALVREIRVGGLPGNNGAKVSTARDPKGDDNVICVYTGDYNDRKSVGACLAGIRKLGVDGVLYYKTDAATMSGRYRGGSRKPWIYSSDMFEIGSGMLQLGDRS